MEETLNGVLVFLREKVDELDAEIETRSQELAVRRSERNRLANAVRALDPPPPKPPKKPPRAVAPSQVSERKLEETAYWLRQHADALNGNGGVYVTKLVDDPEFRILGSEASVRAAVQELHDRDVLVLDRVAQGGRRIYKVVTE